MIITLFNFNIAFDYIIQYSLCLTTQFPGETFPMDMSGWRVFEHVQHANVHWHVRLACIWACAACKCPWTC